MMRIANTYNVARDVAKELYPSNVDNSFGKKMLKLLILCEQWPYRMSWLMQLAEDVWQESILQFRRKKSYRRHMCANEVLNTLEKHGLRLDTEEAVVTTRETPVVEDPSDNDYASTLENHEQLLFVKFSKVSLSDLYEHVVSKVPHAPPMEKLNKELSREGDPQVFESLLLEDIDNDYRSHLRMIDLALPYEFQSKVLNNKFRTLRPLIVNFSRYTVEKTSMYMESFVFHESRDGTNKKHKKLFIESSKQFYEKPFFFSHIKS